MDASPDTIVARATADAWSDRAVIRVSGDLSRLGLEPPDERGIFTTMVLGIPMLALRAVGPASYTGEDTLELLCPGNPHLVDRLVAHLVAFEGVRRAEPGEFTARAYLHGRLTLEQAEGVAMLVAAASDDARRAALRLLDGETGARYHAWIDELTTLLALVEAGIDFTTEEDVVAIEPEALADRVRALRTEMTEVADQVRAATTTPRVVLAGPPNAGKSTLFNALLGTERVIVSATEGTTRDAIEEPLEVEGVEVTLVDLAGLDDLDRNVVDRAAQARARRRLADADVVLHCDPDGRFEHLATDAPIVRVRTKADLAFSTDQDGPEALSVCALDGFHLGALRHAIADVAAGAPPTVVPRHAHACRRASGILADLDPHAPVELVAGALREALDVASELGGRLHPDEVLGRVFSTFCVGK